MQALSSIESPKENNLYTPIEVFIPETDTCIVDTCGYGALIRVNIIIFPLLFVFIKQKILLG